MRKPILAVLGVFLLSGCFTYRVRDGELGQNWNEEDQRSFYSISQGSQLLKYGWFLALEQKSNDSLFLDGGLRRFGYLPNPFAQAASGDNSHLLPIGFVKDVGVGYPGGDEVEGPWIGMTCAACHTAEMVIGGKSHLIDGAPTDADFYALISGLSESLSETVSDRDKFERFAGKVGDDGSLGEDLRQTAVRFAAFVEQSTPAEEWGKARLDAVGLILNTIAHRLVPNVDARNKVADPTKGNLIHLPRRTSARPRANNTHQPNAPVSYPFIWDSYQQPHNQWNGVSVGTLSRNTTEVLGVFATFDPAKPSKNSVKFGALKELQALVTDLRSPRWDNPKYGLPAIKTELLEPGGGRGKELYREHCQSCHNVFDRNKKQVSEVSIVLNGFATAGFERPKPTDRPEVSIGTDPVMARSFVDNTFALEDGGQLVHATDLVGAALTKVWFKSFFRALLYGGIEELSNSFFSRVTDDLEVYKARPLNGIWATAPYLHNGSVPSVMDLLKQPGDRAKVFCVGSREFDDVNMGFKSDLDEFGGCGDNFKLDTSIEGNSNGGHDSYGVLTEPERLAIIEFIKSE